MVCMHAVRFGIKAHGVVGGYHGGMPSRSQEDSEPLPNTLIEEEESHGEYEPVQEDADEDP